MKMWQGGLRFCGRFSRSLSRGVWTPDADETRFLAGLPIALFILVFLRADERFQPLGPNLILAVFALWCMAYVLKFRKRLKRRSELKRAILAPAVFVGLLLSLRFC